MKIVTIKGEEYQILPSLKNMCLIEDGLYCTEGRNRGTQ